MGTTPVTSNASVAGNPVICSPMPGGGGVAELAGVADPAGSDGAVALPLGVVAGANDSSFGGVDSSPPERPEGRTGVPGTWLARGGRVG
jgi:hypothetical protein